ncbi:hypothetical protein BE08_35340 [Sorangium cellulosum]|uniref:Peptidase C14 caspase domain-containing protein n=1 Tax=Sorangium cellulosum TaxID=56 RepID=A0A150PTE1_SORCE|nr:hypothetical protein BE08_35340 [Sorangium cellulosum]
MASNDYAIIVGIWRYPGLVHLEGPENDAKDFYAWVTDPAGGDVPADHVRMILSSDFIPPEPLRPSEARPSDEPILQAIEWLLGVAGDNAASEPARRPETPRAELGRLYFYVAGHGSQLEENGGVSDVLVTANASPQRLHHVNLPAEVTECFVVPQRAYEVVVIMDCCRTQGARIRAVPAMCPRRQPPGGSRTESVFMYASRGQQESYGVEIDGKVRGAFTCALLMGLRGGASDGAGNITMGSLDRYLRRNMRKLLPKELRDSLDPRIPDSPELRYDPALYSVPIARAPQTKFRVSMQARPEDVGKEIRVLDGGLQPIFSEVLRSERSEARFPAGLYVAEIGEGDARRAEVFELPGFGGDGSAEVTFSGEPSYVRLDNDLEISAADSRTLISLINSSYDVERYDYGSLRVRLSRRGVFKIESTAAGRVTEAYLIAGERGASGSTTIRIPPGASALPHGGAQAPLPAGPVTPINVDPVKFLSPAPLATTSAPDDYRAAAERESRIVGVTRGRGASLLVGVREVARPSPRAPAPAAHPASGLTLRDSRGRLLVDIARESRARLEGDEPWTLCHVEVDPGNYCLTVETLDGPLSQAVIATGGLQTQVFLLLTSYTGRPEDRRADLAGASLFISRSGFDPARPDSRLTELTRLDLHALRPRADARRTAEMLEQHPDEPMLLLLGAHLLLSLGAGDDHRASLERALSNLRAQLGDHPDVEALALRIEGARAPGLRFSSPPMLLASWLAIRDASLGDPELVVGDSMLGRVASRFWGDGPALVWREPEGSVGLLGTLGPTGFRGNGDPAPPPASLLERLGRLRRMPAASRLRHLVAWLRELDLEAAERHPALDDVEVAALRALTRREGTPSRPVTLSARLVHALRLPQPVIVNLLRDLYAKLVIPL